MRIIENINHGWKFIQKDVGCPDKFPESWGSVNLPHTWNAVDGHDGTPAYDRGSYWYAKEIEVPKQAFGGTNVYVEILAAGQQATVYINGKKVAYHEGGYSIFRANLTKHLHSNKPNLLVVNCSNEYKSSVYPQKADFTFYGGLYRGVNLISVPDAHFDLDYFGSQGIKVTPIPKENGAVFNIESYLSNADENFTVLYTIYDELGNVVGSASRHYDDTKTSIFVPDIKRWSIDKTNCYYVSAQLQYRNETFDDVEVCVGVRDFKCDPNEGFFLNGNYVKLRGVSRHQDRLYKGNALEPEDHWEDAAIIKELGANTIRLAHYQHSQDFYDACDELGFIVWAEIPFISVFNEDPNAHENCMQQMTELVVQNYHHPSICFWGLSNEIELGGFVKQNVVDRHIDLNNLCHKLDSTRLTTIAHVSMTPFDSPLHNVSDVCSYNHYFGWYGGTMEENGPKLDEFHKMNPSVCSGLSEYGCEGVITFHSKDPKVKDYSEEYQALYHEHLAKVIDERKYLWSTHVWNMFDFGVCARNEGGVKGRNNKGLVTMDRKTFKDSYFIYKAYWSEEPMVHICSKRYSMREDKNINIKVYSNEEKVSLYVNDKLVKTQSANKDNKRVFTFNVELQDGANYIVASAGSVIDCTSIEKVDNEPAIYILPEYKEHENRVENWFEKADGFDLDAPMVFPPNRYSIKDTIGDLIDNPKTKPIAIEVIDLLMRVNIDPEVNKEMFEIYETRKLESVLGQAGDLCPKGFTESVNAKLIQIEK